VEEDDVKIKTQALLSPLLGLGKKKDERERNDRQSARELTN